MNSSTAKYLGFRMPAEWEKHEAIWMPWPYDLDSFPNLRETEEEVSEFIKEIHNNERVEFLVLNEETKQRASGILEKKGVDLERIRFHLIDYTNAWMRDCGAIFVVNKDGQLAVTRWLFNSWGNKYPELLKDGKIPDYLIRFLKLPAFETGIVMEGGSIEVNGAGTLITTEQCLLNKSRNPNLTKPQIEKYLSDYLGVRNFIWLKQGIEGDDTDGHIDDIARFVNPTTVLCAVPDDEGDKDYKPLKENFDILSSSLDQNGNPLRVVKLPTPGWVGESGRRLPASYANFYISNKKVLVPIFGAKNDEKALAVIQSVFPDRKVVGLGAYNLVFGFGTFHCMSLQQPSVF
ncbi:MAG: agmatine deiminase family protein [bacterium]|nr:agmatine deiminase family protein [bacterium]